MFLKHTGQAHKVIYVTNSYQKVTQNKDNYAALTGIASHFAVESFAAAVAKIASLPGTIVVDKAVAITADTTVGSNITIDIRDGGSFAVSSGKTLTISGPLALNGQPFGTVFTGAGAVVCTAKGVFSEIESGVGTILGGSAQDIHEESTTQNFPIGTRRVVDDRVFRYCHAKGALKGLFEARSTNFPREGNTDAVVYAAGTYEITIPMNPNGDNYVAEQVANYWKDGYIWVMQWPQVTSAGELYRIKSSAAAVAGFVTLTLYRPLIAQVGASTWITAWPNMYANVGDNASARMSVVCVPLIPVQLGYYFWGQTWGPCFLSSGQSPGRKDYDREVYFHPDKSSVGQRGIMPGSEVVFTTPNEIPQRAGFLITNTSPWTNAGGNPELGGDQFFMLQLSP